MSSPLIVALHGVGSSARDMAAALTPLGQVAEVMALDGFDPFDGGGLGRQWFSVAGAIESDRAARVAGAMRRLIDILDKLAHERGVAREDFILLGFSQGAIMTLAMVAQGFHPGRAIAVAGRSAVPVLAVAGRAATLLLVADSGDRVMPARLSDEAAASLANAGHHVDVRHTSGIGHGIGLQTLNAIVAWLAATTAPRATATLQG